MQNPKASGGSMPDSQIISEIPDRSGDGVIQVMGAHDKDEWELALVGKKQVLERRFGLASMIGFSCSIMITWESMLTVIVFGFTNGGPAGLIWGFLVCWIGTTSVFFSMGELASMLPTAGGQYYWTNILAPSQYRRFISYLTGWITIIAWVAALTLTSYLNGVLLQYLVKLNHPEFVEHAWQPVLIMYAMLLFALILNVWLGKILPIIEVFILIIHVFGFFAFLIPLVTLGSTKGSKDIFTTFYNGGGWPNQGLSVLVGLFGNAAAFLGTDGAIHMSEEIAKSSINTPRSMIFSITVNGILGFVLLIVFLLVGGNLQEILQTDSEFQYIVILQHVLGEVGGTTALVSVLITMQTFCGIALASSSSRMVWSFARERAVPGWRWLRLVNRSTSIPTNSNYAVVLCACLLGLISLGSDVTFNALLSLLLEAFYLSYLIPLSLLLYRRLNGHIKDTRSEELISIGQSNLVQTPLDLELTWGPWRLNPIFGALNNIFALAYLIITMFFSFWPATPKPSAAEMNWSVVVLGGVIFFSISYYILVARKQYTGPKLEVSITKI